MTEAQNPADYFCSIQVTAGQSGAAQASTTPPVPVPVSDPQVIELLRTLAEQNRELITLGRKQLELSQRMEERYEKQILAQREEFVRWLEDSPGLARRGKEAAETIRLLLGNLMEDLVSYVDEHRDNLDESEFVRAEMVDRYGQSLNHISAMYGMLKRLSTADDGPPSR